jgi:hypothetical protein
MKPDNPLHGMLYVRARILGATERRGEALSIHLLGNAGESRKLRIPLDYEDLFLDAYMRRRGFEPMFSDRNWWYFSRCQLQTLSFAEFSVLMRNP